MGWKDVCCACVDAFKGRHAETNSFFFVLILSCGRTSIKDKAAGTVVTRSLIILIWTIHHIIGENTKRAAPQSRGSVEAWLTGDPAVPPSPASDVASDDAWEGRHKVFHGFIFSFTPLPCVPREKGKDAIEGKHGDEKGNWHESLEELLILILQDDASEDPQLFVAFEEQQPLSSLSLLRRSCGPVSLLVTSSPNCWPLQLFVDVPSVLALLSFYLSAAFVNWLPENVVSPQTFLYMFKYNIDTKSYNNAH